jgi:hypothetical protein
MPPYAASAPRLILGILVFILAVVFFATGQMEPKLAAMFGLTGIGLMFA